MGLWCGHKAGYRLGRTFVDETEDAPFKDKMVLDGRREVCLSGLMVGQMVRVLQVPPVLKNEHRQHQRDIIEAS